MYGAFTNYFFHSFKRQLKIKNHKKCMALDGGQKKGVHNLFFKIFKILSSKVFLS